jgi:hypothetical protein
VRTEHPGARLRRAPARRSSDPRVGRADGRDGPRGRADRRPPRGAGAEGHAGPAQGRGLHRPAVQGGGRRAAGQDAPARGRDADPRADEARLGRAGRRRRRPRGVPRPHDRPAVRGAWRRRVRPRDPRGRPRRGQGRRHPVPAQRRLHRGALRLAAQRRRPPAGHLPQGRAPAGHRAGARPPDRRAVGRGPVRVRPGAAGRRRAPDRDHGPHLPGDGPPGRGGARPPDGVAARPPGHEHRRRRRDPRRDHQPLAAADRALDPRVARQHRPGAGRAGPRADVRVRGHRHHRRPLAAAGAARGGGQRPGHRAQGRAPRRPRQGRPEPLRACRREPRRGDRAARPGAHPHGRGGAGQGRRCHPHPRGAGRADHLAGW